MIEVVVATIAAVGIIVNTLVANRARQHSKAAREQVENNHESNLREEGDERHEQNTTTLGRIEQRMLDGFAAIDRRLIRLAERDDVHDERIHDLERTQPPKETP